MNKNLLLIIPILCYIYFVTCKPLIGYCTIEGECGQEKRTHLEPNQKTNSNPNFCEFCYIGMPIFRALIDYNKTEHFQTIATIFCDVFNIVDPVVCSLAIKQYEMVVLSVIKDSPLSDQDLCNYGLNCAPVNNNPLFNWTIPLPNVPKPPVIPPTPPKKGSPTIRILHLSDLHIDFQYQPGSPADCLDPLCCRNISTPRPHSSAPGAGYWGDYRNCDVPVWTVESMFNHIANNEKFDFVYWTGDLPPHNVWNQTRNDQLLAIDFLSKLFIKYFPDKVMYPTLGNHEAAPCNLYPPPFVVEDNINWLYSAIAKNWTSTGLPQYLAPDIEKGGFYTFNIFPGLRIISLNMNYCDSGNYWLLINSTDPLNQLKWLANVLQNSENIGEKIHIIGHQHPSSCINSWSIVYYDIVNRYENIIVGQFFGHSHSDYFNVFYDLNNTTRATNVLYIGGSVTTYSNLNPAYRIYTVDGNYSASSFRVLDHETHYLNITDANLTGNAVWKLEYSAKDAYGLENLFPQDWANLIDSIIKDLNGPLFDKVYKYYSKSSDAQQNCDDKCRIKFICDFKEARSDGNIPC